MGDSTGRHSSSGRARSCVKIVIINKLGFIKYFQHLEVIFLESDTFSKWRAKEKVRSDEKFRGNRYKFKILFPL